MPPWAIVPAVEAVLGEPASRDTDATQCGVSKLLVLGASPAAIPALRRRLSRALWAKRARIVRALDWTLEILPAGSSKARGVSALLDSLGVDPSNVMAVGDGENDLEMFDLVGTPVAMGNAVAVAKRSATMSWEQRRERRGAGHPRDGPRARQRRAAARPPPPPLRWLRPGAARARRRQRRDVRGGEAAAATAAAASSTPRRALLLGRRGGGAAPPVVAVDALRPPRLGRRRDAAQPLPDPRQDQADPRGRDRQRRRRAPTAAAAAGYFYLDLTDALLAAPPPKSRPTRASRRHTDEAPLGARRAGHPRRRPPLRPSRRIAANRALQFNVADNVLFPRPSTRRRARACLYSPPVRRRQRRREPLPLLPIKEDLDAAYDQLAKEGKVPPETSSTKAAGQGQGQASGIPIGLVRVATLDGLIDQMVTGEIDLSRSVVVGSQAALATIKQLVEEGAIAK